MAFVTVSNDWNFNGRTSDEIRQTIEEAMRFVSETLDRKEVLQIGDSFGTQTVFEDYDIWSLGNADCPVAIPRELFQELVAWLDKAQIYLDVEPWPAGFGDHFISIGDEAGDQNPDVAWVHHSVRAGRQMACFSLARSGKLTTISETGSQDLYFARDEKIKVEFWREVIVSNGDRIDDLIKWAPNAYPKLYFHDAVLRSSSSLSGGYDAAKTRIQDALAALNDYGNWVFTFPPPSVSPQDEVFGIRGGYPSNQLIERRFQALGLSVAPEKPNVRENSRCRTAREITVGGSVLYCQWHVKIEPHRNRIHIHAPTVASQGKTVIGIIHEHLPLP